MSTSLVTIILPTYKNASGIEAAIESVRGQSFSNWELIIVDDGLYPEPKATITKFENLDSRISSVKNDENIGVQKSLNKGLKMAKGELIARIDDDDVWIDTEKLAKQVEFLMRNQDHVLVGTNAIICDDGGQQMGTYALPQNDAVIRSRMLLRNCFIHPSVVMRKQAVEKAGGYSESGEVKHIEDYELWLRLGCIGKLANIDAMAVRLTAHAGSLTFQNRLTQARRMWLVIYQYRKKYPNFILGRLILSVRIAGFLTLKVIPLPKNMLYKIQELYKKY